MKELVALKLYTKTVGRAGRYLPPAIARSRDESVVGGVRSGRPVLMRAFEVISLTCR